MKIDKYPGYVRVGTNIYNCPLHKIGGCGGCKYFITANITQGKDKKFEATIICNHKAKAEGLARDKQKEVQENRRWQELHNGAIPTREEYYRDLYAGSPSAILGAPSYEEYLISRTKNS